MLLSWLFGGWCTDVRMLNYEMCVIVGMNSTFFYKNAEKFATLIFFYYLCGPIEVCQKGLLLKI